MHRVLLALLPLAVVTSVAEAQLKKGYPVGMFAELPHERGKLQPQFGRVDFAVTTDDARAADFFCQGLAQLFSGDRFEASRSFREVVTRDAACAMGYWGIALCVEPDLSRSKEFAWEAYRRREAATPLEQRIIELYAQYFDAVAEPEMVIIDAETGQRRARVTTPGRGEDLVGGLAALVREQGTGHLSAGLLLRERLLRGVYEYPRVPSLLEEQPGHPAAALQMLSGGVKPELFLAPARQAPALSGLWDYAGRAFAASGDHASAARALEIGLQTVNGQLRARDAMPYERDGYVPALEHLGRSLMLLGRQGEATAIVRQLKELPIHRHRDRHAAAAAGRVLQSTARTEVDSTPRRTGVTFPETDDTGPLHWSPTTAAAFELPRGDTVGTFGTKGFAGRPVLVVFYLGFGCVHCVEQLHELRPRYQDFKKAGVEIIAVGSDTPDEVRASIQQGLEADAPQMRFKILCDPAGDVFRAFHCWDEFEDEALHGTFLIDAQGRIRWRDISEEPFMETDFLLRESSRLLRGSD